MLASMGQLRTQLSVVLGVVVLFGAAALWLTSEGDSGEAEAMVVAASSDSASNANPLEGMLVDVSPLERVGLRSQVDVTGPAPRQGDAQQSEQSVADPRLQPPVEGVFRMSVAIQLYVHGEPSADLLDGSVPVALSYRRRRGSSKSE